MIVSARVREVGEYVVTGADPGADPAADADVVMT
jgi:hypothetical protein